MMVDEGRKRVCVVIAADDCEYGVQLYGVFDSREGAEAAASERCMEVEEWYLNEFDGRVADDPAEVAERERREREEDRAARRAAHRSALMSAALHGQDPDRYLSKLDAQDREWAIKQRKWLAAKYDEEVERAAAALEEGQ